MADVEFNSELPHLIFTNSSGRCNIKPQSTHICILPFLLLSQMSIVFLSIFFLRPFTPV